MRGGSLLPIGENVMLQFNKQTNKQTNKYTLNSAFCLQWSYGVTCWELFTGGGVPYLGVDPVSLPTLLETGHRLDKPNNAACSEEM